jgi:hypothetical protein
MQKAGDGFIIMTDNFKKHLSFLDKFYPSIFFHLRFDTQGAFFRVFASFFTFFFFPSRQEKKLPNQNALEILLLLLFFL